MPRLPILGGAYQARSKIASYQRCQNLYPEKNPEGSPSPWTMYQRPGLQLWGSNGSAGPVRGLYRSSDAVGYCVIGQKVYVTSSIGTLVLIGTLTFVSTDPVRFTDNGVTILLVDGGPHGYTISLGSNVFATFVDSTGTFTGSDAIDYIDTFVVYHVLGTNLFGSTHSNSLTMDPLYQAAKTAWPDTLVSLVISRHQLLLFGAVKSEIWYNAGNPLFPFAAVPGATIEHGTAANFSIAVSDIDTFWLGRDLQGAGVVYRQRGYNTTRISNYAVEFAIHNAQINGQDISDCFGFTFQFNGHLFYVLAFTTASMTWIYDATIEDPNLAWHEWTFTNVALAALPPRVWSHAFFYGNNTFGGKTDGNLYYLEVGIYSDYYLGSAVPVKYVRGFPQVTQGMDPQTRQNAMADGKKVKINYFSIDIESVQFDPVPANQPLVTLTWSFDRMTWNAVPVTQPISGYTNQSSAGGELQIQPKFAPIGIGRFPLFELQWYSLYPAALNGAWVDVEVLAN